MAVIDTLFVESDGDRNFVFLEVQPVAQEVRCPECGETLRLRTPDLATTSGDFTPFAFCTNNYDLRDYAH